MRYLYFDSDTRVTILTGSLGWYFKSYWLSLRPYITPDKKTGTSMSATLSLRRYFEDRDNYIGLSGGIGFSPDDRRIQSGTGFTGDGIYVLKSQKAGIAWSKGLAHHFILGLNADVVRQELIFDQGEYVIIASFSGNVRKRF